MVQLYDEGIYLLNGNIVVPESEAQARGIALAPDQARKGTIAYGILKAHNSSDDMRHLKLKFDAMASHDITFVGIIQTARASGLKRFRYSAMDKSYVPVNRTVTTHFVPSAAR